MTKVSNKLSFIAFKLFSSRKRLVCKKELFQSSLTFWKDFFMLIYSVNLLNNNAQLKLNIHLSILQ